MARTSAGSSGNRVLRVVVTPVNGTDEERRLPIFVAHNGRELFIKPGVEVDLPVEFVKALNAAVEVYPDDTGQNFGARTNPRFHVQIVDFDEAVSPITSAEAKEPGSFVK